MIHFTHISDTNLNLGDLSEYIDIAFEGDGKLMQEYHIKPSSDHKECALDTFKRIKEFVKECKSAVDIYLITEGNNDIVGKKTGFLVLNKESNIIYSFGINIKDRSTENKEALMSFIEKQLCTSPSIYLYDKNTRAVNFFKNKGYKEITTLMEGSHKILRLQCQ